MHLNTKFLYVYVCFISQLFILETEQQAYSTYRIKYSFQVTAVEDLVHGEPKSDDSLEGHDEGNVLMS